MHSHSEGSRAAPGVHAPSPSSQRTPTHRKPAGARRAAETARCAAPRFPLKRPWAPPRATTAWEVQRRGRGGPMRRRRGGSRRERGHEHMGRGVASRGRPGPWGARGGSPRPAALGLTVLCGARALHGHGPRMPAARGWGLQGTLPARALHGRAACWVGKYRRIRGEVFIGTVILPPSPCWGPVRRVACGRRGPPSGEARRGWRPACARPL